MNKQQEAEAQLAQHQQQQPQPHVQQQGQQGQQKIDAATFYAINNQARDDAENDDEVPPGEDDESAYALLSKMTKKLGWHMNMQERIDEIRHMKRLEMHRLPLWIVPIFGFIVILVALILIFVLSTQVTGNAPIAPYLPTISASGSKVPELFIYIFVCAWVGFFTSIVVFAKFWQLQVVRHTLGKNAFLRVAFLVINLSVLFWGVIAGISFTFQAACSSAFVFQCHMAFASIFFGAATFHVLLIGLSDILLFVAVHIKRKQNIEKHRRHHLPERNTPNNLQELAAAIAGVPQVQQQQTALELPEIAQPASLAAPRVPLTMSKFRPEKSKSFAYLRRKYLPIWLILYRAVISTGSLVSFIILIIMAFSNGGFNGTTFAVMEYLVVLFFLAFLISYAYDFINFQVAILYSERKKKMAITNAHSALSARQRRRKHKQGKGKSFSTIFVTDSKFGTPAPTPANSPTL